MNEKIELQENRKYIVKQTDSSYPTVKKIEVIEVTQTSVLSRNLDSGPNAPTLRMEIETFNKSWKILEDLGPAKDLFASLSGTVNK